MFLSFICGVQEKMLSKLVEGIFLFDKVLTLKQDALFR